MNRQTSIFDEDNEEVLNNPKTLDELYLALKKMKRGDVLFYKNRRIVLDKYYEVEKGDSYHEAFMKIKDVLKFLEDEKTYYKNQISKRTKKTRKSKTKEEQYQLF